MQSFTLNDQVSDFKIKQLKMIFFKRKIAVLSLFWTGLQMLRVQYNASTMALLKISALQNHQHLRAQ